MKIEIEVIDYIDELTEKSLEIIRCDDWDLFQLNVLKDKYKKYNIEESIWTELNDAIILYNNYQNIIVDIDGNNSYLIKILNNTRETRKYLNIAIINENNDIDRYNDSKEVEKKGDSFREYLSNIQKIIFKYVQNDNGATNIVDNNKYEKINNKVFYAQYYGRYMEEYSKKLLIWINIFLNNSYTLVDIAQNPSMYLIYQCWNLFSTTLKFEFFELFNKNITFSIFALTNGYLFYRKFIEK